MMTMTRDHVSDLRLIGGSAATLNTNEEIESAARSDAKVLITGETGVGKDVVARLIHQRSARRLAAMATVNCAGFCDSLVESELFGHVRGSFTDAYRDKAGILESASNGTVFLDEVGEMTPKVQATLLRFLETGEIQRVGADRVQARVNVRIIAATNRDLHSEIASGGFRQDLYYRLNVIHIHVPPLRDRRDDIPPLLTYFLERYSRQHGVPPRSLSPDAVDLLTGYDWPGNVRQLKNAVERLVVKSDGPRIERTDVPSEFGQSRRRDAPRAHAEPVPDAGALEDELVARMVSGGESFWAAVHAPFTNRDLTRSQLKGVVAQGLARTAGNYKLVVQLFNMPDADYRRFLSFLRKHQCHVPHQSFRRPVPTALRMVWPTPPAAAPAYQRAVGM
jgi:transcriptional regulator with GAF, ATPase, and Fis domain